MRVCGRGGGRGGARHTRALINRMEKKNSKEIKNKYFFFVWFYSLKGRALIEKNEDNK